MEAAAVEAVGGPRHATVAHPPAQPQLQRQQLQAERVLHQRLDGAIVERRQQALCAKDGVVHAAGVALQREEQQPREDAVERQVVGEQLRHVTRRLPLWEQPRCRQPLVATPSSQRRLRLHRRHRSARRHDGEIGRCGADAPQPRVQPCPYRAGALCQRGCADTRLAHRCGGTDGGRLEGGDAGGGRGGRRVERREDEREHRAELDVEAEGVHPEERRLVLVARHLAQLALQRAHVLRPRQHVEPPAKVGGRQQRRRARAVAEQVAQVLADGDVPPLDDERVAARDHPRARGVARDGIVLLVEPVRPAHRAERARRERVGVGRLQVAVLDDAVDLVALLHVEVLRRLPRLDAVAVKEEEEVLVVAIDLFVFHKVDEALHEHLERLGRAHVEVVLQAVVPGKLEPDRLSGASSAHHDLLLDLLRGLDIFDHRLFLEIVSGAKPSLLRRQSKPFGGSVGS